jgi:GAF domain-containing protein
MAIEMQALAALCELARALRAPLGAAEAFALADAALKRVFDHTHLTINRYDAATDQTSRVYSSAPQVYPLAGRKRRKTNGWSEQVIDRGEIHLADDREAVERTFDDHAGITALGCASVLNVPVRVDGRTLGVLNLMGPAGRFDRCDRAIALAFAGLMIPVLSKG